MSFNAFDCVTWMQVRESKRQIPSFWTKIFLSIFVFPPSVGELPAQGCLQFFCLYLHFPVGKPPPHMAVEHLKRGRPDMFCQCETHTGFWRHSKKVKYLNFWYWLHVEMVFWIDWIKSKILKLSSPAFYLFNVATRKFKMTCVVLIHGSPSVSIGWCYSEGTCYILKVLSSILGSSES